MNSILEPDIRYDIRVSLLIARVERKVDVVKVHVEPQLRLQALSVIPEGWLEWFDKNQLI